MSNAAVKPDITAVAQLRDLKAALDALPSSARLSNESARTLYALAYHQAAQGHLSTALRYFSLLVLYRPTHPEYLHGLAHTYRMMECYDEALHIYSFLASMYPEECAYTLGIAECLLSQGALEEAKRTVDLVSNYCKASDSGGGGEVDLVARVTALTKLLTNAMDKANADA